MLVRISIQVNNLLFIIVIGLCLSSEIDTNVNEEVLVAGTCEIVIADVGYTEVEAYFGVDHLIFGTTAKAQTTVETIVVIERVVRVLVFVKFGFAADAKCEIASEEGLNVEIVSYVEFVLEDDGGFQIHETRGLFLGIFVFR
jgi:hypothetical protein